jgi:colanic acid/amylovoran biosynthesis glycosyltransferase
MRIAFVVTEFPSASQTPVLSQIVELVKRGYEVDIYPGRKGRSGITHDDIERYGLLERTRFPVARPKHPLKRIAAGFAILLRADPRTRRVLLRTLDIRRFGASARTLRQFFEVLPFLDSKPYDVVHCQFGKSGQRALRVQAVGALQGALVTSFRGYDALTVAPEDAADVYGELFELGRVFTANTSFLAGKLAELGCPREKTVVLHSAHDVGERPFRERSLREGETVELVTVARLVEGKGIKYAIRAVVQVHRQFPNLHYRIVGDGPLREELRQEIEQSGARSFIELLGWKTQEEVRNIYDGSHVFILPSVEDPHGWTEAQGVVLQEAQAMGLPVIASRVGGIPEGLLEGESALLVPQKDVGALASAIENLIENSERWPEMGRAGRRFVEERFSLQVLTDELMTVYSRAAQQTPGDTGALVITGSPRPRDSMAAGERGTWSHSVPNSTTDRCFDKVGQ